MRVVAGARGIGGCRVPPLLITPLPQPSSSSPRVYPTTPPAKASVQPRHPARYISLLPSCEAAAPIPRGEVAWGGQDIPPRAGGDRTGPEMPSSLVPSRLLPADLDKSVWLWVANVIWGRAGGNPPPSKNRFRMDNCISQSEQEEGRAPPRPRLFPPRFVNWGRGEGETQQSDGNSELEGVVGSQCSSARAGAARLSSRGLSRRAFCYACTPES